MCVECKHGLTSSMTKKCPPCNEDFSGFEEVKPSLTRRYVDLQKELLELQEENEILKDKITKIKESVELSDKDHMPISPAFRWLINEILK